MKRYKHYIRSSKYLDETREDYLFDDTILIDINITIPRRIASSSSEGGNIVVDFPGVDQFRLDVLEILENEYNFQVIEDMHDGKVQKGYTSNRDNSISVYFDTYFDLSNAKDSINRLGINNIEVPDSGKVFCFIHFRFSDHSIPNAGYVDHRDFINKNTEKYTRNRPDITHVIEEEVIEISERDARYYYSKALKDLRDLLDFRISYWVKKADNYKV